jgi:hypothetical protein
MKTEFHSIRNAPDTLGMVNWPLPLEVIPNQMGINLCSVEGMT